MEQIADAEKIKSLIEGLAKQVQKEMTAHEGPWAFIGVKRRGDLIAKRLFELNQPEELGSVDITLYRDDLSQIGPNAIVRGAEIDFRIDDLNILLIDDVIMSGRSIRSAMQAIMDYGRPERIRLLTLVDRGGRELPIQPDFTGLTLKIPRENLIEVQLAPEDDEDQILSNAQDANI